MGARLVRLGSGPQAGKILAAREAASALASAPSLRQTDSSVMMDNGNICAGISGCVGQTPMIRLKRLSDALGREILCKAEHLNPGGSVKDRAAKFMIKAAETAGKLRPGGTIVEGTAGNTGIGLAMLALARIAGTTLTVAATALRGVALESGLFAVTREQGWHSLKLITFPRT